MIVEKAEVSSGRNVKNPSLIKASNMQTNPKSFLLSCVESFLFYIVCVLLNIAWEKTGEWIFIVLMLFFFFLEQLLLCRFLIFENYQVNDIIHLNFFFSLVAKIVITTRSVLANLNFMNYDVTKVLAGL